MAELREEVGVRESRQEKNGRAEGGGWCESRQKNGGAEGGGWCERESRQKNGGAEGGGWCERLDRRRMAELREEVGERD